MTKRSDSEWSCSVQCGSCPNSIFHTRFVNQYTFFGKFEVKILGTEDIDVMGLFSQISHYSENQIAAQLGHCVKEIVTKMLVSGCCTYHFERKLRDWEFAIPEELGGEKNFAKNILLLNDFLQEKADQYMLDSKKGKNIRNLNLKKVYDNHIDAASRAFASWGFCLIDPSNATAFYSAYIHLKIERTKAILRDFVLSTIEKYLNEMGYNIKFKLSKVRTMNDVDKEIEKLNDGLLSTIDAFKIKEAFA